MIRQFFVYGTLKRGQRNESIWPHRPVAVHDCWVTGQLMGRSDYPAMIAGEDHVLGELWSFGDSDVPDVIAQLDRLEGTSGNQPDDLYHRILVSTFDLDDNPLGEAYTYHYVPDPIMHGFVRIEAGEPRSSDVRGSGDLRGYVAWPAVS